jgi:hypothetical protein
LIAILSFQPSHRPQSAEHHLTSDEDLPRILAVGFSSLIMLSPVFTVHNAVIAIVLHTLTMITAIASITVLFAGIIV